MMKRKVGYMGLAALLLLAPFCVVAFLFVQEYQEQRNFAFKEREGLQLHNNLFEILITVQRYRGERFVAIATAQNNKGGQLFKEKLLRLLKIVEDREEVFGLFGQKDQWLKVKSGLVSLIQDEHTTIPSAEFFEQQRKHIVALTILMQDLAWQSNLAVDPDIQANAMANVIGKLIPKAVDDLALIRRKITADLAMGKQLSASERRRLSGYEGELRAFKDDYSYFMRHLRRNSDTKIVAFIEKDANVLVKLDESFKLFNSLAVGSDLPDYTLFFDTVTASIADLSRVYYQLSKFLGAHIHAHQQKIHGRLIQFLVSLATVLVLTIGIFIAVLRAMVRHEEDSARQIKAIVDTVLDGLVTIDDHGIVKSFNPAATHIFGYQPNEVIGQNVKMLMPEPYHSHHDGYIKNYLISGNAKVIGIGREVAARRKDGSVFPMELGINAMQIGHEHMFVGTIRDISARKESELAIQHAIEALKRSNQELDDFAYIASHDLKEPLRGLSNNAIFLQEDYGNKFDEDGKRRLGRITYLCERMERLVDDLLYFSRLGRQDLAVQKTDLNQVIHDIASMMETTLQESNTEIRIPLPLPVITCDLPRVTEVFRNLITNAVKYNNKPEKWVEVGVTDMALPETKKSSCRVYYVKDNGVGIAEEFHEEIFRIFKRLNSEDDHAKGTGVGLTFVRKIVGRHGGRVWVNSKLGEGATFYFTLNEANEGKEAA